MKQSIVIYRGPSMLDGAPIVCVASTGSSNVKTGAMVQTWIMRADVNPSEASARGLDSSVCGLCPRRHSLGGDCYVQIVHAPRSTWKSWDDKDQPGENWADQSQILALQTDARSHGLRLGSYGDPAAVPYTVWIDLIGALQPAKVLGYTHQWARSMRDTFHEYDSSDMARAEFVFRHRSWLQSSVMASCDSTAEDAHARSLGWRTFTAIPAGTSPPERSIQCPATRETNPLNCYQCGICDGAKRGAGKASVYLLEHGMRSQSKAKRSAGLQVLR